VASIVPSGLNATEFTRPSQANVAVAVCVARSHSHRRRGAGQHRAHRIDAHRNLPADTEFAQAIAVLAHAQQDAV